MPSSSIIAEQSAADALSNRDGGKALRASESRYRRLFETAQDGILLLNADTAQIEDVNPYLIEMLGYSHAEFLGKKLWEVGPFADIAQSKSVFTELQQTGYAKYKDLPLKTKAGAKIAVEFVSNSYDCEGVKVIQCNIRNITERNADRALIQRQSNLYAALSQCHKAIIHSASEADLFPQICRAAVQFGGVKMAWIGIIDSATLAVKPVASFADDSGYLSDIEISVDPDSPLSRGATGTAIRERQPFWCQDFANDPATLPWREGGALAGWASAASLPLHRSGTVVGAFTLYSGEKNAFDAAARELLIGMVADISFALDNFDRESQRKRINEEIEFKNTILQTQQEASLDAILVVGENRKVISYNQKFIDLFRIPRELLRAGMDEALIHSIADQSQNSGESLARLQHLYEHRGEMSREELVLKDGRIIDRYSAPATGADGKYHGRVWYFRDITESKMADRKFRNLLESAPDAMVIVNNDAEMMLVNAQAVDMFGWRREELIGRKIETLIPERFRGKHPQKRAGYLSNSQTRAMGAGLDLLARRKDGTEFPVEISLSPLETDKGTLVISAIRDITERKNAERTILRLNRVYAMLSGINTLIVRIRDRDELFAEACGIAVEAGGFRMALIAVVDRQRGRIVPVASAGKDEALKVAIRNVLASGQDAQNTMIGRAIREKRAVVSNDSLSDPQVLFAKEYAQSGVGSMAVLPLVIEDQALGVIALYASEKDFFHEEEMTLLRELAGDIAFAIDHIAKQERLDYLAYYDVLTGLANRSLFLERVAQYMRSAVSGGHKLVLFMIDLERFRNINDSLGRSAGEALLKQVAEWLTRNVGDASLLARIEADHFAVVMPEVRQESDVARILEKAMQAFSEHPFCLNSAVFRIAAKVGIAQFPDDGVDVDTLLKHAEAALKNAKASGDRYLFYTQKMTEAVAGRLSLETQLRHALENGEFVLHYQPKVHLASGKLTGAEALLRWNDPRTGIVMPAGFIPILEETGLIHEVGRWALRTAIDDYLRWHTAGMAPVRIAVNVSALQLRSRDFIDEIKQAIAIDARASAGLELEITESLVMEDVEHSIESLRSIRAMNVTIAIDDFGTGFSSLSYLSKLPVDSLKIDRSFVIGMTAGPEGLSLVSTIINLAHSLDLKVVAEGVETEEQSNLLRLLRCDEMQGYLFGRPVPGEIFAAKYLRAP